MHSDIKKVGIIFLSYFAGLTDEELCELASSRVPAVKTSRRDFPYVLASKARNAEQWAIMRARGENHIFHTYKFFLKFLFRSWIRVCISFEF